MTHHILTIQNYLWNPITNLLKMIARIGEKLEQRRMVRITIHELDSLSSRELADLGISRGDIYYIANSFLDKVKA